MRRNELGQIHWHALATLSLAALCVALFWLLVLKHAGQPAQTADGSKASASDQQVFEWRLVTSWPKNFPGLGLAPEYFARTVKEMSGGRLNIQVYGAGELVPAFSVFDSVSSGSVEMGHTAAYYHRGKMPAAAIFTALPFGLNVLEMNAWLYYGEGRDLWRELYKPFNVIPFPGGNTGMQMGGWFNREVNSIEDLRGLKMRIPGLAGEIFTRAGGSAVALPGGEIYTSMQTGVIDATEWVGPYNDRSFGLHEVGKYYYYPGWHEMSAQLEFEVNIDAWNSLPADLQAIIETAARAANFDMINEYLARNATALASLEEQGIKPRRFSDNILKPLNNYAQAYYQELKQKDPDFARIHESYSRFKDTSSKWMNISERVVFESRDSLEND